MIINPSTIIKFYSGMPLDNTYTNTLFWSNKTNQTNFFHINNPYYKVSANVSTYQRINKGVCEVEVPADDLYDCNYMAFQNSNYGSKWFYAFVTSIEYVNNANSRVYYEIDVMQTYYFEAVLKESFVVREHSVTDNPGDNLLDEPVSVSNYVCGSREEHIFDNFFLILCRARFNPRQGESNEVPVVGTNGNLLNAVDFERYDLTDATDIRNFQDMLYSLQGDYGSIVLMYLYPRNLCGVRTYNTENCTYELTVPPEIQYNVPRPVAFYNRNNQQDNYVPKNKKLLCYPYNYLCVDFGQVTNQYRYEYFNRNGETGQAFFTIEGDLTASPEILLVPNYYNGSWYSQSKKNYDEQLRFTDLPKVAFPISTYESWLAQDQTAMVVSAVGSVVGGLISGGVGAALGGIAGETLTTMMVMGTANSIFSNMTNMLSAKTHANDMTNKWQGQPTGNTIFAKEGIKFVFKKMQVEYNEAKKLDDYFTKYGYVCNELKIPSRNNRPHWTYLQTDNCNIVGEFPSDDIARMKSIYNKGITFWNYASEVGDYSLDNSPN